MTLQYLLSGSVWQDVNCLQGLDDAVTSLRARGVRDYDRPNECAPPLIGPPPPPPLPHLRFLRFCLILEHVVVDGNVVWRRQFGIKGAYHWHGWKNGDSFSFWEDSNKNGSTKVLKVLADCCTA